MDQLIRLRATFAAQVQRPAVSVLFFLVLFFYMSIIIFIFPREIMMSFGTRGAIVFLSFFCFLSSFPHH